MTILPNIYARQKGWLPLVFLTLLTIVILIISMIFLISGHLTIFQNLFYFPIILACVYYVWRGFIFSVILAWSYFLFMIIFSPDPDVLKGAFIRVLIFILVAGVITYLSVTRIRAEDAHMESEEFNRGLVENLPNLVIVFDHDRKIRYVNDAATVFLGYSPEEMVGTDLITYVIPHQQAEIVNATHERFTLDNGDSLEVDLITKSGQPLTVISKGAPIHFQNQPAVLVLFADISERKLAEEALRQANHKLNLLSSITRHDIGNQLQLVFGYLGFVKDADLAPEVKGFVEKADDAAHTIHRQISFTKDYEEIGVHSPTWQNVGKVISHAIKPIDISPIKILIEVSGIEIFADPLMEKVFCNLVDNAKRYGETISEIRFFGLEGKEGYTIICEDNGVGIPNEFKSKIFNREYFKHTGFGLNLSREILEITGITITETGEPGKGARFEILVPAGKFRVPLIDEQ
jgi:PAS domain S-box-containing protein